MSDDEIYERLVRMAKSLPWQKQMACDYAYRAMAYVRDPEVRMLISAVIEAQFADCVQNPVRMPRKRDKYVQYQGAKLFMVEKYA